MTQINWHKMALRIFSLFLAVLLWIYAAGEQNPVTNSQIISIGLQQMGAPDGMVVSGSLPSNVSIRVVGPRARLDTLSANDFQAVIDLSQLSEGAHNVPVVVHSPEGVEISRVTPSRIYLVLEGIQEKQVAVVANVQGKPARGYIPQDAVVQPDTVVIRGPRSLINTIEQLAVEVNIESASTAVEQTSVVETGNNNITVSPQLVKVIVPINSAPSKDLKVNPRLEGEPAAGYTVSGFTVSPANVRVFAVSSRLQELSGLNTEKISIDGAKQDLTVQAKISAPSGIEDINPSTVEVTVRIVPEGSDDEPPD